MSGNPVDVAKRYNDEGADELTFFGHYRFQRQSRYYFACYRGGRFASFIPLTVGGGVRTVADIRRLLNAGAR